MRFAGDHVFNARFERACALQSCHAMYGLVVATDFKVLIHDANDAISHTKRSTCLSNPSIFLRAFISIFDYHFSMFSRSLAALPSDTMLSVDALQCCWGTNDLRNTALCVPHESIRHVRRRPLPRQPLSAIRALLI